MICIAGKCIKCGCEIASNGAITPKFEEVEIELENKKRVSVGICKDCDLTRDECDEAVDAVYKALKKNKEPAKAIGISKRITFIEMILESQGNCCPSCGEEIGEKYIMTQGPGKRLLIMHERCPVKSYEKRT